MPRQWQRPFVRESAPKIQAAKENDQEWVHKFKKQSKEQIDKLKNVFNLKEKTEETELDLIEKELEALYEKHEEAVMGQRAKEASAILGQIKELEKRRS